MQSTGEAGPHDCPAPRRDGRLSLGPFFWPSWSWSCKSLEYSNAKVLTVVGAQGKIAGVARDPKFPSLTDRMSNRSGSLGQLRLMNKNGSDAAPSARNIANNILQPPATGPRSTVSFQPKQPIRQAARIRVWGLASSGSMRFEPHRISDMPSKLTLANLLPHDGPVTRAMTRLLKVLVIPGGPHEGLTVREAVRDRRVLTSVRFEEIQVDLAKSTHNELRLAPDSPFLTAQQRSKLDALGVIRNGERIQEGDVLVGLVTVARNRQPTKAGMQWVRDASRTVPPGWDGAVVESSLRTSPRPDDGSDDCLAAGQVKVELRVEHDLVIGDVLSVREQMLGIVGCFVPDEETPHRDGVAADIVVSLATAEPLGLTEGMHELEIGKGDDLGQFNVHALRGWAPFPDYPATADRPLCRPFKQRHPSTLPNYDRAGRLASPAGTQRHPLRVGQFEIRRLAEPWRGPSPARGRAPPADYPRPGTPHSLYLLRAELMALGLHVECQGNEHVTLSLRPATRDELLSLSHGAITRPETIHFRTLEEIPGGLLCPKVFGGDYRFGHIALPAPIVPYLWRIGSPSALESMLGFSRAQIESLVNYQMRVRRCGDGFEWRDAADALPVEERRRRLADRGRRNPGVVGRGFRRGTTAGGMRPCERFRAGRDSGASRPFPAADPAGKRQFRHFGPQRPVSPFDQSCEPADQAARA